MSAPIKTRHVKAAQALTLYECASHNDPASHVTRGECVLCVEQDLADQEATTRKEAEAETVEAVAVALEGVCAESGKPGACLSLVELAEWLRSGEWEDTP